MGWFTSAIADTLRADLTLSFFYYSLGLPLPVQILYALTDSFLFFCTTLSPSLFLSLGPRFANTGTTSTTPGSQYQRSPPPQEKEQSPQQRQKERMFCAA